MKTSAFSPEFLEAVRAYVEKDLNYEWSYRTREYERKRDYSCNSLTQPELPFVTVTKIVDFEDYTYYGGYCETCEYTEAHCKITYETGDGDTREYDYDQSFSALINALVEDDGE